MIDMLFLAVCMISFWGMGNFILLLLKENHLSSAEHVIVSISLGMLTASYLCILYGLFHWYQGPHILITIVGICIPSSIVLIKKLRFSKLPSIIPTPLQKATPVKVWGFTKDSVLLILITIITGFVLFNWLRSCVPTTDWDTNAYHFALPKLFITDNTLNPPLYTLLNFFYYNTEMLYVLGMALHSDILALHIGWAISVVLLGVIIIFALRYTDIKTALLGGVIFYSIPLVYSQAGGGGNDIPLCLWIMLSFYLMLISFEHEDKKLLLLSGMCMGAAVSTKVLGLFFVCALGILLFFLYYEKYNTFNIKKLISISLWWLLPVLIFGSPWYIRNFLITHNPFYPFLTTFIPSSFTSPFHLSFFIRKNVPIAYYMLYPITISFRNVSDTLGPFFILLLPLISFNKTSFPFRKYLVPFCIYLFFGMVVFSNVPRYLLPACAIAALPAAVSMINIMHVLGKKIFKYGLIILCGLYVLASLAYSFARTVPRMRYLLRKETREHYLLTHATNYPACVYINEQTPKNSIILALDTRVYYLNRKYYHAYFPNTISPVLPPWTEPDTRILLQGWKKLNITHLMIFEDYGRLLYGRIVCTIIQLYDKNRIVRIEELINTSGGLFSQQAVRYTFTSYAIKQNNNVLVLNDAKIAQLKSQGDYMCSMHLENLKANLQELFRNGAIAVYKINY